MKRIAVFVLCALLGAVPCLGAELSVPGLDELWQETESYGVEAGTGLDEGLSNLLADGAAQVGGLLRTSLSTALKKVPIHKFYRKTDYHKYSTLAALKKALAA